MSLLIQVSRLVQKCDSRSSKMLWLTLIRQADRIFFRKVLQFVLRFSMSNQRSQIQTLNSILSVSLLTLLEINNYSEVSIQLKLFLWIVFWFDRLETQNLISKGYMFKIKPSETMRYENFNTFHSTLNPFRFHFFFHRLHEYETIRFGRNLIE